MSALGVIAFVVALLFSIMVHEAGHFLTAKHFHMKVTEFFLGFGKRLWSFKRGETEFGIKAIPAGGYCRIVGMSAREVLPEEDQPRAFIAASAPKRLVVLGAGSFLHFVLGFLLLFILYAAVGTTYVTTSIAEVVPCLSTSSAGCTSADSPSPAKAAGLLVGDEIQSINGTAAKDWSKAVLLVRNSPGKPVNLVVKRNGALLDVTLVPTPTVRDKKTIGVIGIVNKLGTMYENPYRAAISSAKLSRDLFTSSISSLVKLPGKIPALVRQTFGGQARDPQGLVGVVGVARVSAQAASDKNLSVRERIGTFILIIASLNIFVGIFNLLPFLPLDGGHMALAFVDGVRRIRARRRGVAMPAPIDVERLTPITIVVFLFLAVLSVLLLGADIFNPIHLNV